MGIVNQIIMNSTLLTSLSNISSIVASSDSSSADASSQSSIAVASVVTSSAVTSSAVSSSAAASSSVATLESSSIASSGSSSAASLLRGVVESDDSISPGWYYYYSQPMWEWFLWEFFLLACVYIFCLLLCGVLLFLYVRYYYNKDKKMERVPEQFMYMEQGEKQNLSGIHSVSTACIMASHKKSFMDNKESILIEEPVHDEVEAENIEDEKELASEDERPLTGIHPDVLIEIEEDSEKVCEEERPVSGVQPEMLEEITKEDVE